MKEKHTPQDDGKVLGDINPEPSRTNTQQWDREAGSSEEWEEPETGENAPRRQDRPGARDLGQSTEGTGGGSRNYRPATTTGSDIGNIPE